MYLINSKIDLFKSLKSLIKWPGLVTMILGLKKVFGKYQVKSGKWFFAFKYAIKSQFSQVNKL